MGNVPRRAGLHPAHRARLEREDARVALTECAMPLCTGKPLYDNQVGNLGICFQCGLDVAAYFDKLDETPALTERKLQRRYREMSQERRREEAAESRAIEPGWIYYVRVTDRIKIGYSTDVRQRMRAYPPHAELLAVHPGTRTLEREIHRDFAGHLAQGREWFRPDAEVLAHVDKVVADFGPPPKAFVYTFREQGESQRVKIHRSARNRRKGP